MTKIDEVKAVNQETLKVEVEEIPKKEFQEAVKAEIHEFPKDLIERLEKLENFHDQLPSDLLKKL